MSAGRRKESESLPALGSDEMGPLAPPAVWKALARNCASGVGETG